MLFPLLLYAYSIEPKCVGCFLGACENCIGFSLEIFMVTQVVSLNIVKCLKLNVIDVLGGLCVNVADFKVERNMLIRAKYDSDLVKFITQLAEEVGITAATFTVIGAVKDAKLGFYDQTERKYYEIIVNGPHEIASCIGNVSLKDGERSVHAHVVLSDKSGSVKAGHLITATVFAAEIHLLELKGTLLKREYDEETGLFLWSIK
ncbi:MAG: DNA-binding protein [Candidatus Bathyarchaeia archaeon]